MCSPVCVCVCAGVSAVSRVRDYIHVCVCVCVCVQVSVQCLESGTTYMCVCVLQVSVQCLMVRRLHTCVCAGVSAVSRVRRLHADTQHAHHPNQGQCWDRCSEHSSVLSLSLCLSVSLWVWSEPPCVSVCGCLVVMVRASFWALYCAVYGWVMADLLVWGMCMGVYGCVCRASLRVCVYGWRACVGRACVRACMRSVCVCVRVVCVWVGRDTLGYHCW